MHCWCSCKILILCSNGYYTVVNPVTLKESNGIGQLTRLLICIWYNNGLFIRANGRLVPALTVLCRYPTALERREQKGTEEIVKTMKVFHRLWIPIISICILSKFPATSDKLRNITTGWKMKKNSSFQNRENLWLTNLLKKKIIVSIPWHELYEEGQGSSCRACKLQRRWLRVLNRRAQEDAWGTDARRVAGNGPAPQSTARAWARPGSNEWRPTGERKNERKKIKSINCTDVIRHIRVSSMPAATHNHENRLWSSLH